MPLIEKIQIELEFDADARSRGSRPYLDHEDFIKYCNANGVYTNATALEAYEKKRLLFPCFRLLYPPALLKRRFRARPPWGNGQYSYKEEWAPLINLENALSLSQIWRTKHFKKAMDEGHPLEYLFAASMPFIATPSKEKYRAWSRYNIVEGSYANISSKKSRVIHCYATWKIFFLDELNISNTVRHNRATGQGSRSLFKRDELHPCTLDEYMPYLQSTSAFSYQYDLLEINYLYNSDQRKADWRDVVEKSRRIAQDFIKDSDYKQWIRFLRRLIELHVDYQEAARFIICEEVRRYISRSVHLIRKATGFDFKRICSDVSGYMANKMGVGIEAGVHIYSDKLEKLLADEKWDLEHSVGMNLPHDLKKLNETLVETERIPEVVAERLFEDLANEPGKMALVAIRKMNRSFNRSGLYSDEEMWSGVCDLATSVEVHGKEWLGGKKLEDVLGKLCSIFSVNYGSLKNGSGIISVTDAKDAADFLNKLKRIRSSTNIPIGKRCGRHLLIAHLVRNYTSHQKGLTDKILRENLGNIYGALINTLFILYAAHKKQ